MFVKSIAGFHVFASATLTAAIIGLGAIWPGDSQGTGPGPRETSSRSAIDVAAGNGKIPGKLMQEAEANGSVKVIVHLNVPQAQGPMPKRLQARLARRAAIGAAQGRVLSAVSGKTQRISRQFRFLPYVAMEVGPGALNALRHAPGVVRVTDDFPLELNLADSVPLIGADQLVSAGLDGSGWAIAVVDTGVDSSHPFLAGKVIAEACYSIEGDCPGGLTSLVGSGAGVPCTFGPSCFHGTHVAGIAAGLGSSFSGVAPGADLVAIQVFSRFPSDCQPPCDAVAFISDLAAGLDHVLELAESIPIVAVNMSLGGGMYRSQTACDNSLVFQPIEDAMAALRDVEIASVVASGNDSVTDGLRAPACSSLAVSVGATTKSDQVAGFSNSAPFLSLLAPGVNITSSLPLGGEDDFGARSGTSMAAPHVAGAWALLKQEEPSAGVVRVAGALEVSGKPITDHRNGLEKPRIDLVAALGDSDGDGFDNLYDNCPATPNPSQVDDDGDLLGNLCDNCPADPNPLQKNFEGDLFGDVCDDDDDNDHIPDLEDRCPEWPQQDLAQPDANGDCIPDECQCGDANGDGWLSSIDMLACHTCIYTQDCDFTMLDLDLDGKVGPYDCEPLLRAVHGILSWTELTCERRSTGLPPDVDGDGISDCDDLCPAWPQTDPAQTDSDGDGIPDECQCGDTNGDGFLTSIDAANIASCSNDPDCPAGPVDIGLWDTNLDGFLTAIDVRNVMTRGQAGTGYLNQCTRRPEGTEPP